MANIEQEAAMKKKIKRLESRVAELEKINQEAKGEAEYLATAIWKKHYRESSPEFELCDSTAGILTQIDNMVAGLVEQVTGASNLQSRVEQLEQICFNIWMEHSAGDIDSHFSSVWEAWRIGRNMATEDAQ